jgi:hypothetical protein
MALAIPVVARQKTPMKRRNDIASSALISLNQFLGTKLEIMGGLGTIRKNQGAAAKAIE